VMLAWWEVLYACYINIRAGLIHYSRAKRTNQRVEKMMTLVVSSALREASLTPSTSSGRKRVGSSASHSPTRAPRCESLANLPITGPGLDLAAELGRVENKDVLSGNPVNETDHSILDATGKHNKRRPTDRKMSLGISSAHEPAASAGPDIEALRTEVKALKDANKALSLYAFRIISQEGFEHVLAIDYGKEAVARTPASAANAPSPPQPFMKTRPQSVAISRSSSIQSPLLSPTERLTTFHSIPSPKTPPA
jgi:hypothetical protein